MAASVQLRPLGMVMREVDEDLAIFLGMRNNAEKQRNDHLVNKESDGDFDVSKGPELMVDGLLTSNASQPETLGIMGANDFLNLESENSDFDWLLAQPDNTSVLPSVEVGVQDPLPAQTKIPDELLPLESEPAKTSEESTSTSVDSSSAAASKRPSSSGSRKPTSRAATPTGRPVLPAKPKPSRPSTPNSRAKISSSKPVAPQARSTTPAKAPSRSSTPSARPSVSVVSKSAPRSATPTRTKSVTPSISSGVSAPVRSSSGKQTSTNNLKNPVLSRGTSPTVKSRPTKPMQMLSQSHDATENPKASLPKRPASASRGRRSAPDTHLSSSKPRQKSCSPAKVRAPICSAHKTGSIMLSRSRGHSNGSDDVNPVLMGTQMVERVVNMRKLAPPKQDEYLSHDNPRQSSQENSGFGRSLSKKSLDMAIRHMDIRRSINDTIIRPVATGVLSSSSSSGARSRSGSSKNNTGGASVSPVASLSGSSESSISINSRFLDV